MFGSRFARFLLLLGTVLAITLGIVYRQSVNHRLNELTQSEEKYVALLTEALADDFLAVVTDLLVLAESGELRQALDDPTSLNRQRVSEGFQRFTEKKRVYDQIRFLDLEGMEIVRVNFRGDHAEIVPDDQLQLKVGRYYFHEAKMLVPGQVFVSPFDLNVEDGRIEQPAKPTIRFATPVFDSAGNRRGIIVLNYLGHVMLGRFARLDADSPGLAMLLNSDGYWLYDAQSNREWGFMYPSRRGESFASAHAEIWQRMERAERGTIRTSEGLFSFASVQPFRPDRRAPLSASVTASDNPGFDRRWYVVSLVTNDSVAAYLSELREATFLLTLLLFALVMGVSWALAKYAVAREQSEVALRSSEGRFRQMADSIAEVFWLSTVDRTELLYVSPAFQKIWGQAPASYEEAWRMWQAAIHPEDREQAMGPSSGQGPPEEFKSEYRIVRPDGTLRWIWNQGFVVRDDRGQIVNYAGIAEDVTPLKETQQRLLQSTRLAAIGEAITGLAHESRNALQRSQMCLEMLGKRVVDRPEAVALVDRTQQALRDLHYLYERVRNYAAPLQLEFERCDLRQIWTATCDDLADQITDRAAIIAIADPRVPDVDTRLQADPTAIRQVFRNILENALAPELDAGARRHQVKVEVTWAETTVADKPTLAVTIRDNGPGCPSDVCERIFDPFFTTKTRGTGLGMAICRRIVTAHGGSITATCDGVSGLTVNLLLPKVAA